MILKLQRSPIDDEDPVQAFNRDRSFQVDIPFETVENLFGEKERTVFCHAQIDPDGDLSIGRKLRSHPDW